MKTVVEVHAFADRDGDQWRCWAQPIAPWTGLFAWGDNFQEAREGLAEAAWTQLAASNTDTSGVAAVRILCVTRKTFGVNDLSTD